MVRTRFYRGLWLVLALGAIAGACSANTIVAGAEDWAGSGGPEHNGDFNDMVFQMSGSVAFNAPGGVFNNLTASVVNENGNVFWDNPSGDGSDMNIGYTMLNQGSNQGAGQSASMQYLAMPSGASVNDVTFSAEGAVTITMLGGITAGAAADTLGWYDSANPWTVHLLFSSVVPGETATFTPTGAFAFYSDNGWNQGFSSVTSDNEGENSTQQHFAFFTDTATAVPEPSPVALAGIGLALLALGGVNRRRR